MRWEFVISEAAVDLNLTIFGHVQRYVCIDVTSVFDVICEGNSKIHVFNSMRPF